MQYHVYCSIPPHSGLISLITVELDSQKTIHCQQCTFYLQTDFNPYSRPGSYSSSCIHWLSQKAITIHMTYIWVFALYISGKSDVSSSQNVPNNNFYQSQTSKNSNKDTLKNRLTKYYKRCRRTIRSAFLRLRRWVSEHRKALLWHWYYILSSYCTLIYLQYTCFLMFHINIVHSCVICFCWHASLFPHSCKCASFLR